MFDFVVLKLFQRLVKVSSNFEVDPQCKLAQLIVQVITISAKPTSFPPMVSVTKSTSPLMLSTHLIVVVNI